MKNRFIKTTMLLLGTMAWSAFCDARSEPLKVFVSVLPQKYFVDRIAGENVRVEVMVGIGQSPETYDPLPKQLVKLSTADVYFSTGVPFEKVWMSRMRGINNHLEIVDISVKAAVFYNDQKIEDPHIWVSPVLAKISAKTIMETLVSIDPENAIVYQSNFRALEKDLSDLDKEIREILGSWVDKGTFLVMHPAWGHFAKTYGLEQIAIEHEGKSPGARTLQLLIKRAKQEKVKVVFIQDQHSSHMAETVASAIGAEVVKLDPLAVDYIENLREVARKLTGSFIR